MGIGVALVGSLALALSASPSQAQAEAVGSGLVYVVEVSGEVGLGSAALVERAVTEAALHDAALLVVKVDTPGGRVDAALRIRSSLIGSSVPVVAFVDREALSAGALAAGHA